ncbi:MAG: hypothetical protein R3C02_19215 [Planctomycetaceae bacterium]
MSVDRVLHDHFRAFACETSLRGSVQTPLNCGVMRGQPVIGEFVVSILRQFSPAMLSCLLLICLSSMVHAQGVRPYQPTPLHQAQRGGVRQFDGNSPGVRQTAPGVRELGDARPQSGLAYYGIMGAVSQGHGGTYSTAHGAVSLSKLLSSAQGLSEDATGMAQIIRNGRAVMQVFLDAKIDHQLLPGDLVVFQRDLKQEQVPPDQANGVRTASGTVMNVQAGTQDRVEVAFVGILDRRPIIVPLDPAFATVADVLSAMHQHRDLAKTLRVIRTDTRLGLIEPGQLPERLVDGDVLVFDPQYLNRAGLSQAQEFPAAIPMSAGQPTGFYQETHEHTADLESFLPAVMSPGNGLQFAPEATLTEGPITEPVRAFDDTPLPAPDFPSAEAESTDSAIPFAPMLGTVDEQITHAASVHQTSHDFEIASQERISAGMTPAPQIEVPELTSSSQPAPVTDLFEPVSLPNMADSEIEAAAHFESDHDAVLAAQEKEFVPEPRDPTSGFQGKDTLSQVKSLNTASIALAVLVLAAMCFAVSVVWSRIDRTAQSLQQRAPSVEKSNEVSQRRTLDRLIENNLPIIEERGPFLKPSDFHGKEVGKRRLMIDEPHALAGPHFALNASKEQKTSESRSKVKRRSEHTETGDVESRLERVVEHVRMFRRDEPRSSQEIVSEQVTTSDVPPTEVESPSKSGLLDRVLVAMERERRR